MNRVGEYIRFAVLFTGAGYIVMWSLTMHSDGIAFQLSPGLHIAGMMSSACTVVGLAVYPLRRRWRARATPATPAIKVPEALLRARLGFKPPPPPPRRYVQPRAHFGLRGSPH
jgi:hypothetical protein